MSVLDVFHYMRRHLALITEQQGKVKRIQEKQTLCISNTRFIFGETTRISHPGTLSTNGMTRELLHKRRQLHHLRDRLLPFPSPMGILQEPVRVVLEVLGHAIGRPGEEKSPAFERLARGGETVELAAEELHGRADGGLDRLDCLFGDEGFDGGAPLAVDVVVDGAES